MAFDCRMIINQLNIKKNQLKISVAISCPFDMDVTSPKAKIVFECGSKTRRLPFLVTNYFSQKQSNTCIVVCSYTFLLDKLFYNYIPEDDIKARIEFYYGENEIERVPFTVSCNVLNQNPGLVIDEQYLEYESFNGFATFEKPVELDPEKEPPKSNYTFSFDCANSCIIISKTDSEPKKSFFKIFAPMAAVLRLFFFILRTVLAVLLLPYFIVDGALAALGILPKRHTKPIRGLPKNIFVQIKINLSSFLKTSFKKATFLSNIRKPVLSVCKLYYKLLSKKEIVPNRITFMSGRHDELVGNSRFVYDQIKDNKDLEFRFLLFSDPLGHNKLINIIRFLTLYSTSKIIIIDDYFRLINLVEKRDGVKLIQLWHACGAFKTFGFSRLGKKGGPKQTDPNHRMYDYSIVSSQEIAKHYSEGFGLSDECIAVTGIPRTDIFMDSDYSAAVKARFYERYPQLKNKKIILFAPTFRGNGQISGYYPIQAFNPVDLYEQLGGKYAILIKLHPFCEERYEIPKQYGDVIIDLSQEDELNDLLFVTDLLITDYSSVIFEASLLDIPMLFYAYDLYKYIPKRKLLKRLSAKTLSNTNYPDLKLSFSIISTENRANG